MQIVKKLGDLFGSTSGSPPDSPRLTGFAMPWQPGMKGDGKLVQFVHYSDPGIAIGFQRGALSESQFFNFFGDLESLKPFYEPAKPGAELLTACEVLKKLDDSYVPSDIANALTQGYLNYVAEALNLIYETPTGHRLINGLLFTKRTIYIGLQIAFMGNSYTGGGVSALVSGANQLIDQIKQDTLDTAVVLDLVMKASKLTSTLPACNWLAGQVNGMPLLSLWVQDPQYTDGFLGRFLRFKGNAITGQVLADWLTKNDAGAFTNFLKTDRTKQDEVVLTDYFKSALIMLLYGRSVPGNSCDASIQFRVTYEPGNDKDQARERPPAIGLGHELVHSYNVAVGAQSGIDIFHFSTMLTERLCVGLPPFDTIATITENALRAEWNLVAAKASVPFDQRVPGPRLVYDPVPLDMLLETRDRSSTP